MREFKIIDTQEFVKAILDKTKLFRYECSDKNSDPAKKSREVIVILNYEALLLNEEPDLWLGYNAFNSIPQAGLLNIGQMVASNSIRTFPYIPRSPAEKVGNHFILGKELHYKGFGQNPQF